MLVRNRTEAGVALAAALGALGLTAPVVLGLPRGGIPVGFMIAQTLRAPLDVIVVRKLGVPHRSELAMGAVGENGICVVDDRMVAAQRVTGVELSALIERERAKVADQAALFRAERAPTPLAGRQVVLVDDGVATGSTMIAACRVARAHDPARVVVAVPVSPVEGVQRLRQIADEVVCLHTPHPFLAVGQWYHDFTQVTDAEVVRLLSEAVT